MAVNSNIGSCLDGISSTSITPLDLVPREDLAEKLIELAIYGPNTSLPVDIVSKLEKLVNIIRNTDTSSVRVVVFGGGTGLSNILGGDSRRSSWPSSPFKGLKNIFPNTRAITCITDDGGSTGELLKDLPLIALGDIRHVLLSSVQRRILKKHYGLAYRDALEVVSILHALFNHRFIQAPVSMEALLDDAKVELSRLPDAMCKGLENLIARLFSDQGLENILHRSQCLGNLILVSSIYQYVPNQSCEVDSNAVIRGISHVAELIGADPLAVLPCSTTPARLQVLYSNGVLVTGEHKSSVTRRGFPIERVFVQFARDPHVPEQVIESIENAHMLVFAPGSLYTSIIPVLHVPGIAEAVRKNTRALKILVANLWAQEGETDISRDDPGRRFYVSDLVAAYSRNIPGGVKEIFQQVLVLGLKDIPGSILQRYAVEDKIPIYLDAIRVEAQGLKPIEASIFSKKALRERRVVQHDPEAFSIAMQTLWAARDYLELARHDPFILPAVGLRHRVIVGGMAMCDRFEAIRNRLGTLSVPENLWPGLMELFWHHKDIMPEHLDFIQGIELVEPEAWTRSQEWDNILSFFDLNDGLIKIRKDVVWRKKPFETSFLVALGESLLGNYAKSKSIVELEQDGRRIGKIFQLELRPESERNCFLSETELFEYLRLARMNRVSGNSLFYTRLINGKEGFTPPGLLFGLMYAWYLDNQLTGHIEYKMSIMKNAISDLIPEQAKMLRLRKSMINFFRKVVFRLDEPGYE